MEGQMSIFGDHERDQGKKRTKKTKEDEIDFSCFASFRSEVGGVRYGECTEDHICARCEAHTRFYEKAEEYYREGNTWGRSVALTCRFFEIPTVPEYDVEAYPQ